MLICAHARIYQGLFLYNLQRANIVGKDSYGQPEEKTKRTLSSVVVPILLVLLGIAIISYPLVASQYNNYRQQVHAGEYNTFINNHPSQDVLARGLGHLYGTDLPVGGINRRSAITGHTGMLSATLFDQLIDVKKGDIFYVDVLGKTLKYQVKLIEVVKPDELDRLQVVPGHDLVTLVTCTP